MVSALLEINLPIGSNKAASPQQTSRNLNIKVTCFTSRLGNQFVKTKTIWVRLNYGTERVFFSTVFQLGKSYSSLFTVMGI